MHFYDLMWRILKEMIVELNQTERSALGLAKEYCLSEATLYN